VLSSLSALLLGAAVASPSWAAASTHLTGDLSAPRPARHLRPGRTPARNVIVNPSLERSGAHGRPVGWQPIGWGTNTTTFSYLTSGHRGRHSLEIQTTDWTNGAAEWYYGDRAVKAGATYRFSDWYRSNAATEVDAEVVNSDGTKSYYFLGPVPPSEGWTPFVTSFIPPTGTRSISIYHALAKAGDLTTDDYSLTATAPAPFRRAIVSIDFDDGWASQYANAVPALMANGLTATFYIITSLSITAPNPVCMDVTELHTLISDGYEIGNHTDTHPDLTTLEPAEVQTEMGGAQSVFQAALGITPTDFAYPYGAYDPTTVAIGEQVGFASQRSVNAGMNTKGDIDFTQLKVEEVTTSTTPAEVEAWVNQAIASKSWLILLYHQVDTQPAFGAIGDGAALTTPATLNAELTYIKSSGVAVETTSQAITEITPQLHRS
jgi:peptidoglycan/xylan/chitin deacetylase (PgdA/CDA1 family)